MDFFIVGRKQERLLLEQIYMRDDPDFLAVYGRRRVGKTFLLRNFFKNLPCTYFEVTGLKDGTLEEQIQRFLQKLKEAFLEEIPTPAPKTWIEAFQLLTACIRKVHPREKIVLFFDELPWLAVPETKFIQALDHFWNTEWQTRKDLKLITCGSAASWMLENLIHAKGGLHNRLTAVMSLKPFSLQETEEYLLHRNMKFNRRQILELYMAMGGIPHYLNAIDKSLSPAQNINRICFTKNGLLFTEFEDLFSSLFNDSPAHVELVRLIARSRKGIEKKELLKEAKLSTSGGTFKERLAELEEAGFIASFVPYMRRKKGTFYRVIDEYTLFYLHWIEPVVSHLKMSLQDSHYWESKMQSQAWKSWAGYAFEALCLKHIEQMKDALGIRAIAAEIGGWRFRPKDKNEQGVQIDLLIDRADGIINLCEMKYWDGKFVITKNFAEEIQRKILVYKTQMQPRKTILVTMVTPDGVLRNEYTVQVMSSEVTLNDLFS